MIRTLSLCLIFIVSLFPSAIMAQDFQGEATYQSHRKMNLKLGDGKQQTAMQKEMQAQIAKQMQQEYTLKFNREASIYKKEEQLSGPSAPSSSGFQITISDGSDIMYKNLKENRYINKTEFMGKLFLIKDQIKPRNWVLSEGTKNIGQYTCYKATLTDTIKTTTFTDDGKMKEVDKERITTAWYTPQIPLNTGPSNFGGLPGLILEINDGSLTLICSKIVLNPDEKFEIEEPKNGKEISQEEFDVVQEKKNKEMMDRFKARKGSGKGEQVIIIGG